MKVYVVLAWNDDGYEGCSDPWTVAAYRDKARAKGRTPERLGEPYWD